MVKTKFAALASLLLFFALPAFGWTYKSTYSVSCSDLWPAVKDTLGNADNYSVVESDDAKMTASYHVKHAVHANVSGAVLQRTNKVALVTKGSGCEMHVVSNYSGWEHDDKGDFKKRVDEALARLKTAKPSEPSSTQPPAH